MLVALGLGMVATFMVLIITKRATPVVALILVPVAFGLFAGAGLGISDMITDGIKDLAPTAAMLFFAIIFFGIMIDVGLFDPVVRAVVRAVHDDPARLVVGTAVLAGVVSLDGDGSTTFIITTAALLPLYLKLGVSPVVLTVVAGLTNGTMNILPWGGPTARAASALNIDTNDVFVPMVPALVAALVVVLLFAYTSVCSNAAASASWRSGIRSSPRRKRFWSAPVAEPACRPRVVGHAVRVRREQARALTTTLPPAITISAAPWRAPMTTTATHPSRASSTPIGKPCAPSSSG